MPEPNRVPSDNDNLVTSLKVGVFMSVLGWMVLAIEAPQLIGAPNPPQVQPTAKNAAPAVTSAPSSDYFPAQFPSPKGEPEASPPTF